MKGIPLREAGVLTLILTSSRPPLQTPKALSGGYDKSAVESSERTLLRSKLKDRNIMNVKQAKELSKKAE